MARKTNIVAERLKRLGAEVAKNLRKEQGVTQRELSKVREAAQAQWQEEQTKLQAEEAKLGRAEKKAAAQEEIARSERTEKEKPKKGQDRDKQQDYGHEH
jgi:hypothetical protein